MDVESQLVITFRESFTEFPLDGPVAWADVVLDDVVDDQTYIFYLG